MQAGDLIAERFEVHSLAGEGGMGSVYRARDLLTGERVAVKVVRSDRGGTRFAREAKVLAQLDHPRIVRYLAHGETEDHRAFLAMEWLEGVDLEVLLEREGRLGLEESVQLVRRIAEGVGAAHRAGIVHRDLKPGNVFLEGGELNRVKVIDFGVARRRFASTESLTATGAVLGTPGYLAPEQARGAGDVGPPSDVFALGCILFECLTGQPTFFGNQLIALLAKVLLEDAPRVRDLRMDAGTEIDELVARLLAKEPGDRPADADEVAALLSRLGTRVSPSRPPPAPRHSLTSAERQLLTVVVAGQDAATDETLAAEQGAPLARLETLARSLEARVEVMAGGSLVATFVSGGSASDQVRAAAEFAVLVSELLPTVPVAIGTGRGLYADRLPVGQVVERAAALLSAPVHGIRLDEVTAGLLSRDFAVERAAHAGTRLLGPAHRRQGDERTLLGRPVRCIGRQRELGLLESMALECAEEHCPTVALVTGPAGIGKSLVLAEAHTRIVGRGLGFRSWQAMGDPTKSGSAFGLVGAVLRQVCRISDGESEDERRTRLRKHVERRFPAADAERVAGFLSTLLGLPLPDAATDELRAAREDAMAMSDQIRRAWEDFVRTECEAGPTILLLEDLQWGDFPSVQLLDAALRHVGDHAFLILASARPDVWERFPRLWERARPQRVELEPLRMKSCERFVRDVLGDGVTEEEARHIAETSAGNPLFLEELVRARVEGFEGEVPDTVVAMAHARLARLSAVARRLLRAASVFGRRFWRGGLLAMLDGEGEAASLDEALGELIEGEIVETVRDERFAGEPMYGFRHALHREAAYGMLTDEDRSLGHRLAGEWLASRGEGSGAILAQHFERGGVPERAAGWWVRAAEEARDGFDLEAVCDRVGHAIRCGASDEMKGHALLLEAEARRWRGEQAESEQAALAAMEALRVGSADWCRAAAELAAVRLNLGRVTELETVSRELLEVEPEDGARVALGVATARAGVSALFAGRPELSGALRKRFEQIARETRDPGMRAWLHNLRAYAALMGGDLGGLLRYQAAAVRGFREIGDPRRGVVLAGTLAYAQMELGRYAEAEQQLRETIETAERMDIPAAAVTARHNLGLTLARLGRLEEGEQMERAALEEARGDDRLEAGCHIYLSLIALSRDDAETAASEAVAALDLLAKEPSALRCFALAARGRALLSAGDAGPAKEAAAEAKRDLDALGSIEAGEAMVRLTYAEALAGAGSQEEARAAIGAAQNRLQERADRLAEEDLRETFLHAVPENERTLELALRWG